MPTEKQLEQIAARKAINEAKRAKKPATKAVKKKPVEATKALADNPELSQEFVEEVLKATEEIINGETTLYEPSSEAPVELLEQEATNVLPEGENVSTASIGSLELIKEGQFKMTSEELSEIAKKGTELLLNATPEEIGKYKTYSGENLETIPNDIGLEVVEGTVLPTPNMDELQKKLDESGLTISGITLVDNTQLTTESVAKEIIAAIDAFESGNTTPYTEVLPDCSIDFTNGRSKPAVYVVLGGYGTKEGTYFNEMMKEVVYILTLGGKFDRSVAPRFSGLPFSCKMKVPVDKYSDYVNRVGYPDYEVDKETYKVSLSAPDFRVLLNSLEKYVEQGWECDPKQAVMYKGRYVIPFRLRFPVEIAAGLHCKVRTPIKYTAEELRAMKWNQVKAIAKLHGIEETNHNAVISQLMTIMENIGE